MCRNSLKFSYFLYTQLFFCLRNNYKHIYSNQKFSVLILAVSYSDKFYT
nr:MAG TPA: hypothetical protein [Caudoviricetes sp.]